MSGVVNCDLLKERSTQMWLLPRAINILKVPPLLFLRKHTLLTSE